MAEAQHDFASVDAIDAESIGTPGKRTFRLRILRGDDSAALWMEKQQLAALGEALPRLLEQLNTPDQHADEDAESIASFPDDPTIEFKVGRMALGYAAQEDRFYRFERRFGTFSRAAGLPQGVDETKISASYTNGVLEVRVAKPEEAKPRRIQVGKSHADLQAATSN